MTNDQCQVLEMLTKDWKPRFRQGRWLLKQSGYIDNFAEVPGGQTTFHELLGFGYIDRNNRVTDAGQAALFSTSREESTYATN